VLSYHLADQYNTHLIYLSSNEPVQYRHQHYAFQATDNEQTDRQTEGHHAEPHLEAAAQ